MGDKDVLGAGGGDRGEEGGPVGVVGEGEAAVEGAASSLAADAHPAGGEAGAELLKASCPRGVVGAGRGEDEGAAPVGGAGFIADRARLDHGDVGGAVDVGDAVDGAVDDDGAEGRIEAGEDPLGLAEGVTQEERGLPVGLVLLPPLGNVGDDLGGRGPAIDREAEGGFAQKGVAADRLEGGAGRVGGQLVIAGDDPDLALVLDADLGAAEDVTGGVQGYGDVADMQRLAVGEGLDVGVVAEAQGEQGAPGGGGEVVGAAGVGVVGVGVGDDAAIDGAPGVDVEAAGGAVQAVLAEGEERRALHRPGFVARTGGCARAAIVRVD